MPERDPRALLKAARKRVALVRVRLAHPLTCNLDECVTLFREAQGYLEWLRDSLAAGETRGKLRAAAIAVAGEIRQAGILLEHAAHCGRRWLQRLEPSSAEYGAGGCPVRPHVPARISTLG